MASVGAVLSGLAGGSRYFKPSKGDHFGSLDCEIQVEKVILKPYEAISGRVFLTAYNDIKCYGIRVQLDATINLKFETKIDNRVSNHKKFEGILKDASEPGNGYYIESPIREQLHGTVEETGRENGVLNSSEGKENTIILQPGSHAFPFTLVMPAEPLPSPFRSQYGNLQYKIAAYMRSSYCYVQVAEKPLRFRGYNNLNKLPDCLEPLKYEAGFQKSMFSSKRVITSVLTLDKKGYLPGEEIRFTLSISNPKSLMVRKINVNLVRRVIYNVNGATKTTLVNLDSFETGEVSNEEQIFSSGRLKVLRNCMPSYNAKPVYSVIHVVQFQVKVAEYPGPMKGQIEIVVGTTKDPEEVLMMRRMSLLQVEDDLSPINPRSRSGSIASRLSDSSVMTTGTLPPPYSQLSSRAVSMLSLETLPPHYDELH